MGGIFRFPGGYRWLYISTPKNIRFDAKRQKKRDFMTQERFSARAENESEYDISRAFLLKEIYFMTFLREHFY